ncbi:MAG: hypothetical protein CMM50_06925 [Rhodospirillaceae bacterium]|nr:hypothetical protein [Rhodospirillaceae bacterium]
MAGPTAFGDVGRTRGRSDGREDSGPLTDHCRLTMRVGGAVLLIVVLAVVYFLLRDSGTLARLSDGDTVRSLIEGLGIFGPVAVAFLLAAAIVIGPVPRAPDRTRRRGRLRTYLGHCPRGRQC